ncbi:hypothetical protein PHMEG_00025447 [Phytophthora megakarya]|uniref:Uncharacterized protein n=1 Tax=Phytophthora megakarya TaxID=4795 RepID=A0A225VC46_9STRA|nr:hypothetical protein PHMEG_00025447 [Phytophthora megakarya]
MPGELPALTDLCDAIMTIKIGEPQTDSRIVHFEMSFSVCERYAAIYVKATVNARQHENKRLPEDDQGVKKFNPIHRVTASRIAQATRDINQLIQSENREPSGPASIEYWATVQARQPDGAPIVQPDKETFRQLNYIDGQAQQHREEMSIASSATAAFTFAQALRLLGYDLRPPFRERVIPATTEPTDMRDVDHQEEAYDEAEDEFEEKNDVNHGKEGGRKSCFV